ncbi:Gfo/Idh/MocA family protein [Mariniblastus fucicola]|uniref:Inositol 2-dehydrogenase n=1 Tax=Mariniblastus fucicola TaxID=980251 RepID=A0A5B9PFL8_9BACT|nr:Gfo/Idh/MocA family oxidoreductase [Mariniblastus fucicola]QEG24349.1 Inositol 2-dehydrogenase [Mariniblastus fucicola]
MSKTEKLRGVIVGAGYFSRFHHEAWNRVEGVEIIANCDSDIGKARTYAEEFEIPRSVATEELDQVLAEEKPDFIDIVTPPGTHFELCQKAIDSGCAIICQKPLAPDWGQTLALADLIRGSNARFMVHENWRWQPWYRQIKKMLDAGQIGDVFHCNVHCRMGDGWGEDAYLARQPFFRDYERLFIFETGVHFLDTFRFLFGEVESLFARTARRNPVIKGEDSALIVCEMESGATAVLDANRYNESSAADARYTFGTVRIEGSKGHLELGFDGSITLKPLGQAAQQVDYQPSRTGFAGDCVFALQQHFADCMHRGTPFESTIDDYLKTVALVEKAYESAEISGKTD